MRRSLCILAVLLAATATGQSTLTPYENASLAYRIGYPSDWIVAASPDGDYLNIQPREGSDAHGRVGSEFFVEGPWQGPIDEAVDAMLLTLRESLPELQVLGRVGILDLGSAAMGLDVRGADLTGQDVTFRIVLALHHERLYGLLLKALSSDFASFEPLFDRMQASFVLLDAAGPAPVDPAGYRGTFEGDGLTLTLAPSRAGGQPPGVTAFEGSLRFRDADFTVTATRDARVAHISGVFESGGSRYPFTATLFDERNMLVFVTGGEGYVLFRHPEPSPEPPCNPLVPGSCLESGLELAPPCNPLVPGSCLESGLELAPPCNPLVPGSCVESGSESEPEAPCNPLVPGECSDSSSDRGAAPPIRDPITAPRVEPDMREGIAAFDRHDYATALAVFQPLAQQGVAEAQHYVGYLHEHGLAGPQDHREALRWYRLAAAQGHPTAQNNLGSMYFGGHGVTQDHAEAARWFRLAADQHHMLAQEWLGYLHEHGFGVPRDHLEAIRWYRLAAAQGCQRSQQAIERLSGTR